MGFGDENKAVASRCDGKPAAAVPYLVVEHGVSKFNAPRDHPRIVQGCIELSRAFGANTDSQVFPCFFGVDIFLSSLTELPSPPSHSHTACRRNARRSLKPTRTRRRRQRRFN